MCVCVCVCVFKVSKKGMDPSAYISVLGPNTVGFIPFLDTLITPGPDNTLLTWYVLSTS